MKHIYRNFFHVMSIVILLAACGQIATTEPAIVPGVTEQPGLTSSTSTPISTFTPDPAMDPNCNIQWSRLRIGDEAYLTYGDRPNRVRSEPVRDPNNVIAQIYSDTVVTVVDGPVCAEGFMFWKVEHSSIPGGSGWTAEGNGNQKHWLNPVTCTNSNIFRNHYAIVIPGVQGLRVYDQQGSDGQEIAKISADTILKVVAPPYCTGTTPNLTYWKVENETIPGGSGWVAEYGYEDNNGEKVFVPYLRYFWEADPVAFPLPPTLDSVPPKWPTVASLDLADLNNSGKLAYIANDWASVINADGTNTYELKNPLGSYDAPHDLSWSPDGKFVTMAIGPKLFLLSVGETDSALTAREIVEHSDYYQNVVWSFDGKYIAFLTNTSSTSSIYAMNADGSDLHEISVEHDLCYHPTWSPYGIYLAYICYENGPSIYISKVTGPGITSFEAMGHIVAWSPDGKYLAYSDTEDGLSIVEAATGTHAHTLVPEGSNSFAWSPDSRSIAFTYSDEIFLVNIADGAISNLTGHTVTVPFNFADGYLSWSPDGNNIVFEFQSYSYETHYWRANPIYILDVATGARAQLVDQGTLPVWSPVIEYPIVQLPDCTSGWSQLKAGEQARLVGAPTDPPNRVRAEASKTAQQTGLLYPGAVVDLLEGPVCSDGLVYWKIRGVIYPADVNSTVVPPNIGWTAEGDGAEYYLEPYKP